MNFSRLIYQSIFWRGCNFFSAFLLNLFMARYFEATLMGQISFFLAVLSFVILVGSLNFEASLVYFSADNKQPIHQLLALAASWIVVYCAACWYLSGWITEKYMGGFATSVYSVFAFIYLAAFIFINYYNALFFGKKNFTTPHIVASIVNLLLAGTIVALHMAGDKHYVFTYFLPLYFVVFLAQGILLLILFHARYKISLHFKWPGKESFKTILRYTGYMLVTNLLVFLLYRADYWLLRYLNDPSRQLYELGNYIQVSKMAHIFMLLSSTAGTVVFSTSAAGQSKPESLARLIRGLLLIGGGSLLLIAATGWFVFTALYGDTYKLVYPCLLIVMPGIMALMLVSVTANYLSGIGKPRYNLQGVLLGLVIMVVGDYILIPRYGIYAAAIMSSVGYIVYSAYMLVHFTSTTHFTWHSLLKFKRA